MWCFTIACQNCMSLLSGLDSQKYDLVNAESNHLILRVTEALVNQRGCFCRGVIKEWD